MNNTTYYVKTIGELSEVLQKVKGGDVIQVINSSVEQLAIRGLNRLNIDNVSVINLNKDR